MQRLSGEHAVTDCCAVLGMARSSYYHRGKVLDEGQLRAAIADNAGRYPTYGSWRVKAQLGRGSYGMVVCRHKVLRLLREMNLLVKRKQRRVKTTDSRHNLRRFPNLVKKLRASRPDQIWVADIPYLRLGADDVYLAIIMGQYCRAIRAWHLSWSLGRELALRPLRQAIEGYSAPDIHHSDQGSQYAAKAYVKLLQSAGSQISMSAAGQPRENGYAERLIRTIKEEEVYLNDYRNITDARQQIGHFIEVVYPQRIHSALGYMTPAEYERQWRQENPLKSSAFSCPVF